MMIIDLKDSTTVEMQGICEYSWHPEEDILATSRRDTSRSQLILYFVLTNRYKVLCSNNESTYSRILWSDSGNALVFLEQVGRKHLLHCYSLKDSVIASVNADVGRTYPNSTLMIRDLSLSDDGTMVFFSRGYEYGSQKQESPEVWDTDDPWIYPRLKRFNDYKRLLQLTAWDTQSGEVYEITDDKTPEAEYNPNSQNVLLYNKILYEPQYKQDTDVDLYIKNFRSGDKQPVVNKEYSYGGFMNLSPTGRYVAFFNGNNWWVYDSEYQKTINLTRDLGVHFDNTDDAPKIDKEPYGNPGWLENEKYIILYDKYDIWLMTPDGRSRERITRGREQKIVYRISNYVLRNDKDYRKSLSGYRGFGFNSDQRIIFEMQGDDYKTGYALLKDKNTLETLVYDSGKVDGILMSDDQRLIVFKRSRFKNPPAIFLFDLISKETRLLYQSNEKLLDYDLGRDELINFSTGRKGPLSGALIYPSNFDPDRKYPMIVWIYEKNSRAVNSYAPPSDYEYAGFNILRYVTNGYFVLLPDIEYTIGEPGISALKAVTGLTDEVLKNKFIDKSRVGLIGHSFGGYEAAFIATRTDIFRTVVAGAPITDLVSWYHDIQWEGWDTEQMWRMENHQLRMGGSYYDFKRRYYRNSPLHNVEKLDTPLLLWVGKKDYNVNWYQGIYMFMAMRRLNKEGQLLLFNDEGHCMIKPENKKKLSEIVFSWFGQYLKEGRSE
ncbi:MAG: prolyl oligopeptidase family serine peptidase [Bacteroidales bacterium]|nr:prolyl oligopeptidase family serine peptidase [Bacteroidales bacterium]